MVGVGQTGGPGDQGTSLDMVYRTSSVRLWLSLGSDGTTVPPYLLTPGRLEANTTGPNGMLSTVCWDWAESASMCRCISAFLDKVCC